MSTRRSASIVSFIDSPKKLGRLRVLVTQAAALLGATASAVSSLEKKKLAARWALSSDAVLLLAHLYDEHGTALGGGFDPKEARASLEFERVARPVAKVARTVARTIEDAILERRAKVGEAGFGAYQMMKGLVRMPHGAWLVPHFEAIQAAVTKPTLRKERRASSKKKSKTPVAEAPPQAAEK